MRGSTVHPAAVFYVNLLSHPDVWDRLTLKSSQKLIDGMEDWVPHDELPPEYDKLVMARDRLRREGGRQ